MGKHGLSRALTSTLARLCVRAAKLSGRMARVGSGFGNGVSNSGREDVGRRERDAVGAGDGCVRGAWTSACARAHVRVRA